MIKKLRVTVDGKPYDVTVEMADETPALTSPAPQSAAPVQTAPVTPTATAPPALAPAAKAAAGPGGVPSPLAGRVTAIIVSPGQDVKAGDHLLTLEAMKMNTFVFAPKAGKISGINVAVGDAVNEGQSLVQIA